MLATTISRQPGASPDAIRWLGVAQMVGLIVLGCFCYWPSLPGGFIWDDALWLSDNPLNTSPHGLWQIWFSASSPDYYPLTSTSFWLEWHCWGNDPLGYRVTNLALHLINAGLLWKLLRLLRVPGAWLGALIFVVHPVNAASVAWIAERKNTLCLAFALASVIGWVRSEEASSSRAKNGWLAASFAWFIIALLSKSAVVTLPPMLLLLCWWRRGKISVVDVIRTAPFFLASLASGLACIWYQHRAMANEFVVADGLPARLLIAPRSLLFYLEKFVYPVGLSMVYPHWTVRATSPLAYAPLALLAAVGGLAVWNWRARHGRGLLTAFGCFALAMLPVSGVIPTGFSAFSYVSDHFAYFSLVSAASAAAAGLAVWQRRPGHRSLAVTATASLMLLLVIACRERTAEFGAPERLWRHTVSVNPVCAIAHNNLGFALLGQKRPAEAEPCFRRALVLEPRLTLAATNLANALQDQKRWREAAGVYAVVLAQHPDAQGFNNYGVMWLQLDDVDQAVQQFNRALQLEPTMLMARFNLANALVARNDLSAATDKLGECLRLNPNDVPSLLALAMMDIQSGPPGAVPTEAVTLAKRARGLAGPNNVVVRKILSSAESNPPGAGDQSDRRPDLRSKIGQIVRQLPMANPPI